MRRVLKTYKILGFISSGEHSAYLLTSYHNTSSRIGTYGRVYKAVLLPSTTKTTLPPSTLKALSIPHHSSSERLSNPELCMRPGDLPAKEGEVFAIKKFKPDKEGDVQTYAGISQSGAREIMVGYL